MTEEDREIARKIQASGALIGELEDKINSLERNTKENQKFLDEVVAKGSARTTGFNKTFGSVWNETTNEVWASKQAEIKNFQTDRHSKLSFNLKVANMTTAASITGDGVVSYNQRQGLVPNDSVNFRDLIPSSQSPTGIYATYRETGTSGSIAVQTENEPKTQIDYSFTEVRNVSNYIAGHATFSKQLMYQLPFVQGALTRMLLRDFYKKENAYFYGAAYLAATGNDVAPAGDTNDSEELISWIANQRDANFNASFVLISWADWSSLMKTGRNANSGYGVPGGVFYDNSGNMRIAGVNVIAAPWVVDGEVLILDRDFIERIETESLRVEFSFENEDNFIRNMVTARVECFEELSILRTDALIAAEFGGS